MSRRVLIVGVSRLWGAALAKQLEADEDVEEIIAVDHDEPVVQLGRTEFVRADIRHSLIGRLIRTFAVDTVVHAGAIIDTRAASRRQVHETNVIGTYNILAACGGTDSPVETLVVKSSAAIYGAAPDAPSLWRESLEPRGAVSGFQRDLLEMETYVSDFAARKPEAKVAVLRFADVLGTTPDTPFASYLSQEVVPTVLGFDPRLQFVHDEDVIEALLRAVKQRWHGVINVAGEGAVVLSQAIAMEGGHNVPLLPFAGISTVAPLLRRLGLLPLPEHLLPVLTHGRVADTTLLHEKFGFVPKHTALDCVAQHVEWRRRGGQPAEPFAYDGDLEAFLRGKARANSDGIRARS